MGKIYQVVINGFKGEKITIDVGNSEDEMKKMTVLELKKKIYEKLPGKEVDDLSNLRLIFTDKQLEDSCQLSSYGVQDKSIILLVMQLPGGGWLPQSAVIKIPTADATTPLINTVSSSHTGLKD